MQDEDERSLKELAIEVLKAQDNDNLTDVSAAFARACLRLRKLTRAGEGGTATMGPSDCRNHPIVLMWMGRLQALVQDPDESVDGWISSHDRVRLKAGGFLDFGDEAKAKCKQMAEAESED